MPGFTAPKLQWLAEHEPDMFQCIDKVLLPKDYLRFLMSGDFATDMSDAAGTMWLNVAQRDWSDEMLAACGLGRQHMPALFEGNQITGHVSADIAKRWGINRIPIVAGGGDNAAGAVGLGCISPDRRCCHWGHPASILQSARVFSNPASAVHSFATHCLILGI